MLYCGIQYSGTPQYRCFLSRNGGIEKPAMLGFGSNEIIFGTRKRVAVLGGAGVNGGAVLQGSAQSWGKQLLWLLIIIKDPNLA